METIGNLNLRVFRKNPYGEIVEATKVGAPEATRISYETYKASKAYDTLQGKCRYVEFNGEQLLNDILEKVNAHVPGEHAFDHITVYKNHAAIDGYAPNIRNATVKTPMLTPDVGVDQVTFSRFIAKLPLFGDDKYNAALAVKWEPDFCQVALGLNVRICDNYNIFAPRVWSTNLKLNYENLIVYVEKELKSIEDHFGTDVQTIQNLIDVPVSPKDLQRLVGDMSIKYAEDAAILNITDINALVRNIVSDRKSNKTVDNLWDFTNAGTRALHFNNNGGDRSLENIESFNKYIIGIMNKQRNRQSK
jgi:hypothetical protein